MRSFTFSVELRTNLLTNKVRMVYGRKWYALAMQLAKEGRVEMSRTPSRFLGYGNERHTGYLKSEITVTELPGAFSA